MPASHAEFCVVVAGIMPLPLQVRLKHKDTNMYLSSSKDLRFGQPIQGQQEVCGVPRTSKDAEWYAAEGVYLPRTDAKKNKQQGKGGKDKDKDEL